MKNKIHVLISLFVFLLIFSCQLIKIGGTRKITIDNYTRGYQYLIIENEEFTSPEIASYAYDALFFKVKDRYKNPLKKVLLSDLKESITVEDKKDAQYFVLYRDFRIYDLIKFSKLTNKISLKNINHIIKKNDALQSNAYNIMENSFFKAENTRISNASIILKGDLDAFLLKNFTLVNSVFSFQAKNENPPIIFNNVTIKGSHLLGLPNKIKLRNTNRIENSHIQGLTGVNALFESIKKPDDDNSNKFILSNSYIAAISFLIEVTSTKVKIKNCVFTNRPNNSEMLHLIRSEKSEIEIQGSYFDNVRLISDGRKGRLELTNNFFRNYQKIVSSFDQECVIRNNFFMSDRKDNFLVEHGVKSYDGFQAFSTNATSLMNNKMELTNNHRTQFRIEASNRSNIYIDSLEININYNNINDLAYDDRDLPTTHASKGKTGKVTFVHIGKIDLLKIKYSEKN